MEISERGRRHTHVADLTTSSCCSHPSDKALAGIRAPQRTTTRGKVFGGGALSRGQLYFILRNPIYTGDIPHKGKTYPGQHKAISDRDTWQAVQERLLANRQGGRAGARASSAALLAGLIVDAAGEPMLPAHSTKGTVRYPYYVSKSLHHRRARQGTRVPAREIEALVREAVAQLLADPWRLHETLKLGSAPSLLRQLDERCSELASEVRARGSGLLRDLLCEVKVHDDRLDITLDPRMLAQRLCPGALAPDTKTLVLTAPYRLTRLGSTLRLIQGDGAKLTATPDPALVRQIILARTWWAQLAKGEVDVTALAGEVGYSPSYVTRVLRLAFLSPRVVAAVVSGRQHSRLSAATVRSSAEIPPVWAEQEAIYLAT